METLRNGVHPGSGNCAFLRVRRVFVFHSWPSALLVSFVSFVVQSSALLVFSIPPSDLCGGQVALRAEGLLQAAFDADARLPTELVVRGAEVEVREWAQRAHAVARQWHLALEQLAEQLDA